MLTWVLFFRWLGCSNPDVATAAVEAVAGVDGCVAVAERPCWEVAGCDGSKAGAALVLCPSAKVRAVVVRG